jgi:hypothetical protein
MTDDQRIEALEQALRECAEAALDRIEVLEELLVECTEVLIERGGHGELVARIRHLLDEEPPASSRHVQRRRLHGACGDRHRSEAADVSARPLETADLIQCVDRGMVRSGD